jgi:hypothetical protein
MSDLSPLSAPKRTWASNVREQEQLSNSAVTMGRSRAKTSPTSRKPISTSELGSTPAVWPVATPPGIFHSGPYLEERRSRR